MSFLNRIRSRSQRNKGRAKQKLGRATNNPRLQAEGLAERVSGGTRELGEDLKDELKAASKDIERTLGR